MALSAVQPRTYIQLVQDLFNGVGAAGVAPTTIVGAVGEAYRLVQYIHDAELEIQNLWVDWKWLRRILSCFTPIGSNASIFTTAGGAVSAQPTDLAEWDFRTFQIQPIGSTQFVPLHVDEWQQVRDQSFDLTDQAQPWRVIVMPANALQWDLTPDQAYPVQMEYRTVPYDLKADADVSNIPARFGNRLIVEYARMKYGLFENAAEQLTLGQKNVYGHVDELGVWHAGLLAGLENDQLANAKNSRLQQGNRIVIGSGYGSDGDYGYYDGAC